MGPDRSGLSRAHDLIARRGRGRVPRSRSATGCRGGCADAGCDARRPEPSHVHFQAAPAGRCDAHRGHAPLVTTQQRPCPVAQDVVVGPRHDRHGPASVVRGRIRGHSDQDPCGEPHVQYDGVCRDSAARKRRLCGLSDAGRPRRGSEYDPAHPRRARASTGHCRHSPRRNGRHTRRRQSSSARPHRRCVRRRCLVRCTACADGHTALHAAVESRAAVDAAALALRLHVER